MASSDIPQHREPYGFMERELIFKLLASHGLVDKEFFYHLRDHPIEAAQELHIFLEAEDVTYLTSIVQWEVLERHAEEIRNALHLDQVTNSW